ncbi:phage tail sheath family protein [Schinkia sp. CFF1]
MTYKHGIYSSEVPTSVISPVEATAGLQVIVGTAPINLAKTNEFYREPLLAYTFKEAQDGLGYSDEWSNYTLCEAMDSSFRLYGVAPVVLINVLDPEKHKADVTDQSVTIESGKAIISDKGLFLDTLVVKLTTAGDALVQDTDYIPSFNDKGNVVIAVVPSGNIPQGQTTLSVSFTKLDPTKVTDNDIIGGVDVESGKATGLELINSVFPKFGLVPGQIIVPKFSKNPTVEAVMKAKAGNINTYFKAMALTDIDTSVANTYTKVSEWKNQNNYTSANEIPCWPKVALGEKVYHMSTHLGGRLSLTDAANDDLPFVSPSNKELKMNKAVLEDGIEISLGPDQAAYLNGQGIVTALNFIGGWKAWGNRTGAYPSITDVKDSFIPVRRMHNWVSNSIILTTWQKVDDPTNKRLIDTVVDSINIWLNGLTAGGALIGGRVEFRQEENPQTDLLNGTVRFHVFLAEPTPAENIEFVLEFDATYYNRLFAA